MIRILTGTLVAVLAWGGTLLAEEVCLVKVDVKAQEVTVKVCDKDQPAKEPSGLSPSAKEQTLDARRVRIFTAAGKELKIEEVEKLKEGTRFEFKTREGRITELKVLATKY
jgi:hypothetical protein